jgi:hypothetical protein
MEEVAAGKIRFERIEPVDEDAAAEDLVADLEAVDPGDAPA